VGGGSEMGRDSSGGWGKGLANPGSWREVAGHFATGPEAKLVSVRMVRIPAGNAMRGHLWRDEMQLTRLEL
jgi:hypothetical protein